jgi:hypothetical protein
MSLMVKEMDSLHELPRFASFKTGAALTNSDDSVFWGDGISESHKNESNYKPFYLRQDFSTRYAEYGRLLNLIADVLQAEQQEPRAIRHLELQESREICGRVDQDDG